MSAADLRRGVLGSEGGEPPENVDEELVVDLGVVQRGQGRVRGGRAVRVPARQVGHLESTHVHIHKSIRYDL